jgi:hypothetical protein
MPAKELVENGAGTHEVKKPYSVVDACEYSIEDFNRRNHIRVHCSHIPQPEEQSRFLIDQEYTPDMASQGKMMFKPIPSGSNFNSRGVKWGVFMEQVDEGGVRFEAFNMSPLSIEQALLGTLKGGVELSLSKCSVNRQHEEACMKLREHPPTTAPTVAPTPLPAGSTHLSLFHTSVPTAEPTEGVAMGDTLSVFHETPNSISVCRYSKDALMVHANVNVLCTNTEHPDARAEYKHIASNRGEEYFAPVDETSATAVKGWKLVMNFDPQHSWDKPSSMHVFKGEWTEFVSGETQSTPVFRTNCDTAGLCTNDTAVVKAGKSNTTNATNTLSHQLTPEVCTNYPLTWKDSSGHNCLNYETFGWCPNLASPASYLTSLSVDGVGAAKACCTCGGGVMRKVSEGDDSNAILVKSWQPLKWSAAREGSVAAAKEAATDDKGVVHGDKGQCTDAPNWHSSGGYKCKMYELFEWCTVDAHVGPGWHEAEDGSISEWADADGTDAFEACCTCGGGTRAQDPAPAAGPVVEVAMPTCTDVHGFETHVGGVSYTCTDLKQRDWCSSTKSVADNGWDSEWGDVANFIDANAGNGAGGMNARHACCECGGGRSVGMSTAAQSVRHDAEHETDTSVLTLSNKIMISAACGVVLLLSVVVVLAQRTGVSMSSQDGVVEKANANQAMTVWNDSILSQVDVRPGTHANKRVVSPVKPWMNVRGPTLPFATPHPAMTVQMAAASGGLRSLGRSTPELASRADIADADGRELAMWRRMAASGQFVGSGNELAMVPGDTDILAIL